MILPSTTTRNENWIEVLGMKSEQIPVLIIGNNPKELTSIYNSLVSSSMITYKPDVCFDVRDCFNKIQKSKPEVILVDDNLPFDDISKMVRVLRQNAKTKDIKIIVMKSSNWNYHVIDDVDDYILKETINPETIDRLIGKNLLFTEHQPA